MGFTESIESPRQDQLVNSLRRIGCGYALMDPMGDIVMKASEFQEPLVHGPVNGKRFPDRKFGDPRRNPFLLAEPFGKGDCIFPDGIQAIEMMIDDEAPKESGVLFS